MIERLAAQCLLPGFAGTTVPDWLQGWIERGLGGVVLFGHNVESPEQLAALTAELRGLVVAIDEEGGDVTRLEHERGSSYPGNFALGAVDDVELTEHVAAAIGADLAAVGVNFDLAPVADVNSNPRNPVIGIRSFGSEPELVARHVAAFVHGLHGAGVTACAKHFPGHGRTTRDSHVELPVVTASRHELLETDLKPFLAAIEAGVASIMTAHVAYPALDPRPQPVRHHEPVEPRQQRRRREPLETQALTAPAVSPKAIFRCTSRKKTITGIAISVDPAMSPPQSVWRLVPVKYESQTVAVCFDPSFRRMRAKMYSFQLVMKAKIEVATRPGATSGSRIRTKAPRRLEPSTIAASSSSRGIPIRKPRSVHTENGSTKVMYVTISPVSEFTSP